MFACAEHDCGSPRAPLSEFCLRHKPVTYWPKRRCENCGKVDEVDPNRLPYLCFECQCNEDDARMD